MMCRDCKFMCPRGESGGVVKWICGAEPGGSISFDSFPANMECQRPEGPPPQVIPEPEDKYLKEVFMAAVKSYKELWPVHQAGTDLAEAEHKLSKLLMDIFNLTWYDILQLRNDATNGR
ncbi:hypothetical protein [Thermincola ferriacetica]